jgi:hypothetical protein
MRAYLLKNREAGRVILGRAARVVLMAAGVLAFAACNSILDVKNPNNVVEGALSNPGSASALANGAGATFTRAINNVYSTYGTVTDELTYVGSRDAYGYADRGEVSDPFNEFADAAYPNINEARYMSANAVKILRSFDEATPRTLTDRNDLAKAYLWEGLTFTTIGEVYDDFVIDAEKTRVGKPLGEGNMAQVFDSADAQATAALAIAQATNTKDLQIRALLLRMRARFHKAIWSKLNGANGAPASTPVSQPLVSDAGAVSDAQAALALIGAGLDYKLKLTTKPENVGFPNIGNDLNSRLELRAGDSQRDAPSSSCRDATCDQYVIPGPAGNTVTGVKYKDPVTNAVDPVLAAAVTECCQKNTGNNNGDNIPITVLSAREALLILAEARLAANDAAGFTGFINQVRAFNSLTPYNGTTPAPVDMLKHERFVNLFNQGRRLMDMHRFGIKAQKWFTSAEAYSKACFFPVMNIERSTHPDDFVKPLCRP